MGRDPAGLDSPLDSVTVAGETLGVDRVKEGEARAERTPTTFWMPACRMWWAAGDIFVRIAGDRLERRPGERLERSPGDKLERSPAGEFMLLWWREAASTAELILLPRVLPFVAATLLLFSPPRPAAAAVTPPPGGGPLSDNKERHFFTKLFARSANSLSLDLRLTSLICFPSRVAWKKNNGKYIWKKFTRCKTFHALRTFCENLEPILMLNYYLSIWNSTFKT